LPARSSSPARGEESSAPLRPLGGSAPWISAGYPAGMSASGIPRTGSSSLRSAFPARAATRFVDNRRALQPLEPTGRGRMAALETFLDAVGDTPLVRLHRVTRHVQPTILAKLEMLNPGGSVKDRIGLRMIEAAERAGTLRPGGTIVEPTSGNTGHGLAIAAAIKGYHCILVMTDKASEEKRSLLRAYGAEVVICPSSVTHDSPEHYKNVAYRLAEEIPGACCP